MAKGNDGYFGLCPICKETDGYLSIGSNHWFICEKHRLRWWVGGNLFSDWRDESELEQQRHCEEIGFDAFKDIEPFYPEIEGVVRLKNEGGREARRGLRRKISRSLLAQVRHRR